MEALSRCPHWSVSFAAPDVSRPYFAHLVALLDTKPDLTKPNVRKPTLTVYCSPLDWALWPSSLMRMINLTDKADRAGYYRPVVPRLLSGNHDRCVFVSEHVETMTVTGGACIRGLTVPHG
jgi:hypothetical protein